MTKEQYEEIKRTIQDYMIEDEHGKSTVCNIYFDSSFYELISHSITKPFFKEKIRLRSYNIPDATTPVFLEIKRKCDDIVSKRRIQMSFENFENYMRNRNSIDIQNLQIKAELDYYFDRYNLRPTMYISYEREAFYQKDNMDFRITFDSSVIAREYDLNIASQNYGASILERDKYIMEVKTLGAMPLWLVKKLSQLQIMPCGFSKYGEAYTQLILKANDYTTCVV